MSRDAPDAIVIGSGPNGLAAAITLAEAGRSVVVYEAARTVGGGMRSAQLTQPGFIHDVCSTIQGISVASPFFRSLELASLGVELVHPEAPIAHPLDDGRVALLDRSVVTTAAGLGSDDRRYRRLIAPLVRDADKLMPFVFGPFDPFPRHPLAAARFGFPAMRSAKGIGKGFSGDLAPALLTGLSAHAMVPLHLPTTAAFGLVLAITAHAYGWPVVRGGTQVLADALATRLRALGGEIVTGHPVTALGELPAARAILFDTSPRGFVGITGDRLPDRYRRRLESFRYGPGIFKVDWALEGPIPWRAEGVGRAGTVHLGGTTGEILASERDIAAGRHPERPFVLLVQASRFDRSRVPNGGETGWAYCHVPNGSDVDMTDRIEAQVQRFAPGFRDRILATAVRGPATLEADNANYVGGDINGGIQDWRQLFTRPVARLDPYTTPIRGLYLCSSSTPPGGGVHGMCGVWAARSALEREFGHRAHRARRA
ncbi:MAG TPA: NAD(P)/FAD-dependent oxidoreductase [Candidatus Limnocylindrales bacterium]|nr:NAD(P)/FAD-dependent oxidoreductase [Candidatus Limnocylindrales bacterium]